MVLRSAIDRIMRQGGEFGYNPIPVIGSQIEIQSLNNPAFFSARAQVDVSVSQIDASFCVL